VEYLNALGDNVLLRSKTIMQLKITDEKSSKKSFRVVSSGAIPLKKLNQLVAYLTRHTGNYNYRYNLGKSTKGSYFELFLGGSKKLWLGSDKTCAKNAKANGVGYVTDKEVKLIQVFQGLNYRATRGIVFDSNESKNVSLAWVSSSSSKEAARRYSIKVEGILPYTGAKRIIPLPRLVDYECGEDEEKETAFGMPIMCTNYRLRGNRNFPPDCGRGELSEDAEAALPICKPNGIVENPSPDLFSNETLKAVGGIGQRSGRERS